MSQPTPEARIPADTIAAFHAGVTELLGGVSLAYNLPEDVGPDVDLLMAAVPPYIDGQGREWLRDGLGVARFAVVDPTERLGRTTDSMAVGAMLHGDRLDNGWVRAEVVRLPVAVDEASLTYGIRVAFSVPGRLDVARRNFRPKDPFDIHKDVLNSCEAVPEDSPLYVGLGALSAITRVLAGIKR